MRTNVFLGLAIAAIALVYGQLIRGIAGTGYIQAMGADSLPKVLFVVLLFLGLLLAVYSAFGRHGHETVAGFSRSELARVLVALVLIVGYFILMPKVGFDLATLAFLICFQYVLQMRKILMLVTVAVAATMIFHIVFINFLLVPLPLGLLRNM